MRSTTFLLSALALSAAACGARAPRAPLPTRPIDEPHALALMARAMREAGAQPAAGRDVQLVTGKRVHVDVMAAGRQWGIAYITDPESKDLKPNGDYVQPAGDDLPVIQGYGPDAAVKACLLFAHDYTWEESTEEQRSQHNIAAERRLQRDVTDFVVQAGAHRFE